MHHTVELAPAVEELLRRTGVKPEDIRAVGVAQGPGSYTALRIGMAFAAGFAVPHNLPVYGIPTFEILVRAQPATEKIWSRSCAPGAGGSPGARIRRRRASGRRRARRGFPPGRNWPPKPRSGRGSAGRSTAPEKQRWPNAGI